MSVGAETGRRLLDERLGWIRRLRLTQRQREEIIAYILISPWVIGFLVFILGPMLTSLGLSLTETDLFTIKFVGIDNYTRLLSPDKTRSLLWTALYNTGYYVFLSIPLTIGVGFFIAILLNQNISGRSSYRVVYYLPAVIPAIATSLLWLWLFQPEFGLINWFLSVFGIEGPRWLFDPKTAKLALVIMSVWGAGANMLIFLAGLQGIPTELYEAATIDGAGVWRRFRNITIPMISPTLFFVLVTSIIWSFQVFTNVYVMTEGQGGPAHSTLMYVLYLYQLAFRQYRMGFASALAWIFFMIIMLFTLLIFKSSSAWVYYETEIGGRRS
jgi:multiple sugar transport system permease protein